MSQETSHIRINLFSFFNHEQETNKILENFGTLLCQDKVFDKSWGFIRKKVEGTENSFYIGGGRMYLPKRQLSFYNEQPPREIFGDIKENDIEKNIQDWCNSADIFLLCLHSNNKPETKFISRLNWYIKKHNRNKTILYTVTNYIRQFEYSTFDEYANFSVTLNQELNHAYFPYSETNEFINWKNEKFCICKELFCFTKQANSYIDFLLFCLNQLYKDIAEIKISDNKAYHYKTTNINFKSYNNMGTTIKLAIVGAPKNGKSHLIWDIYQIFEQQGRNLTFVEDDSYASPQMLANKLLSEDALNKTPHSLQTKSKNHYKGQNKDFILEFMDVAGEAFDDGKVITEQFRTIKMMLKKSSYFNNNKPFIEHSDDKKISITFNKNENTTTQSPSQLQTDEPSGREGIPQTQQDESNVSQNNLNRNIKTQQRNGKYIAKNFERYDTESLIACLKQVVTFALRTDGLSRYHDTLRVINNVDFWNDFYAYVFCDNCTDIVFCDLVTLPNNMTAISETGKAFSQCVSGVGEFLAEKNTNFKGRKKPNMYAVFRGLDAMITCDDQKDPQENKLKEILKNTNDETKKKLLPFVYFLFHLSVYQNFMNDYFTKDDFDKLCESIINNNNCFIKQLQSLNLDLTDKTNLQTFLSGLLKNDTEFTINDSRSTKLNDVFYDRIEKLRNMNGMLERFNGNSDIFPHIYFTAYPICQKLDIHKNLPVDGNPNNIDGLTPTDLRFPLGVYNFITDLVYSHTQSGKQGTDMENYLYLSKNVQKQNKFKQIWKIITR